MKRLLISSTLIVALGFAGLAQADGYRGHGHPPGIQKQLERGKALPPGHQKKHMSSDWRDHDRRYSRDYDRKYWEKRQKARYKQDKHRQKQQQKYRSKHWNNGDRYDYRSSYGYDDRLPPEHRVARIIRDTQVLIGQSR